MGGTGLDRRLGVVVCDHCGAIFDLTRREDRSEAPKRAQESGDKPRPDRAPVALPKHFQVQRISDRRLVVRWRWFQPSAILLLIFAIAWNSFLVGWYQTAMVGPNTDWGAILFPIGHVAAGVVITYSALSKLLNHTVLTCVRGASGKGVMKVRHGPMPWFPQPTIPTQDLEQLYVERKVSHRKNSTTVTWNVLAVTRDHSGLPLIKGLDTLQEALWLEQEIEEVLDIRDRPVAGEYRGEGVHQV